MVGSQWVGSAAGVATVNACLVPLDDESAELAPLCAVPAPTCGLAGTALTLGHQASAVEAGMRWHQPCPDAAKE